MRLKAALRSAWTYQMTDMSGVTPEMRLVGNVYYFNSCAGQLTYKPKTVDELTKFRDNFVNRFYMLVIHDMNDHETEKGFFRLYQAVRKQCRVKWKANLHTRIKALKHAFTFRRSSKLHELSSGRA